MAMGWLAWWWWHHGPDREVQVKVVLVCPHGCGVKVESNDERMAAGHRCRQTATWVQLVRPTARKGKAKR
jgi:hypothetical protein